MILSNMTNKNGRDEESNSDCDYDEINNEISKVLHNMDIHQHKTIGLNTNQYSDIHDSQNEKSYSQTQSQRYSYSNNESDISVDLYQSPKAYYPVGNRYYSFDSFTFYDVVNQTNPRLSDTNLTGNTYYSNDSRMNNRTNHFPQIMKINSQLHPNILNKSHNFINEYIGLNINTVNQCVNLNNKQYKKKKSQESPKNKIHLENILRQKDKRTTVMIRNIPNKFLLNQFVESINKKFQYKYDIIYLPVDRGNKCNLGYGFINFNDPMTIISFYDTYFGQKWISFNSEKRCELVYSKIQGTQELQKYIQKSVDNEHQNVYTETQQVKTDVVLPLRYMQAFLNFYPYSLYRESTDSFIVDSFFNF